MMPRLGGKYTVDIQVIAKSKAEYQTDEYFELDLPVAPAVMVGDAIVTEGADVSQDKIETEIRRQLGLAEPVAVKKGIDDRLFGR
jgi:hypothetical protein